MAAQSAAGDTDRARAQAELIRSRQAIFTMEAILQQAVLAGAEMVMAQVRTVMPTGRPSLANTPRVGGVRLAGAGTLFTVQVPDFDLPIMWDLVVRPNQNREASGGDDGAADEPADGNAFGASARTTAGSGVSSRCSWLGTARADPRGHRGLDNDRRGSNDGRRTGLIRKSWKIRWANIPVR